MCVCVCVLHCSLAGRDCAQTARETEQEEGGGQGESSLDTPYVIAASPVLQLSVGEKPAMAYLHYVSSQHSTTLSIPHGVDFPLTSQPAKL